MPRVADSTAQWEFSTRTRGEVLIAEAREPGIYLALLGVPEPYTKSEVEGWLRDVAGVARDTAAADPGHKPIPALLHHALTGMLFSHAELWDRPDEAPPASVVFVRDGDDVGFGWVGDAEVAILVDEQPAEIHWVTVRDEEGREARAWRVDAAHAVRARIMWTLGTRDADAPAARIEGTWLGGGVDAPRGGPPAVTTPAARVAPAAAAPPPTPPRSTVPAGPAPAHQPYDADDLESIAAEPPTAAAAPPAEPSRSRMGSFGQVAELPPGFPRQIPPPHDAPEVGPMAAAPADPRAISLPLEQPPPLAPFERARPVPIAVPEPVDDTEDSESPPEEMPWVPPAAAPAPMPSMPSAVVVVRSGSAKPAWAASLPALVPVEESPEPVEAALEAPIDPPLEEVAPPEIEEESVPPRRGPVLSPDWPDLSETTPWWKRAWPWLGAAAVVLIAAGWLVGSQEKPTGPARAGAAPAWQRMLGLAGPRFELTVRSRPEGAWISVDGRTPELRTPAIVELPPGEHRLVLSLSSLGEASYSVRGRKDERVTLDAVLTGTLEVYSPDAGALIAVAVDGEPQGFAPLTLDSLLPGAHDVRFSGPGMASWGQTVEIVVGETKQILTRPLRSPATGMLVVRSTLIESGENGPLEGARVWIDGVSRGMTPLQLELPRGPHSIRVTHGDAEAPIQVIDLPGGNQRFADFELSADTQMPRLAATLPARIPDDPPVVLSAALEGLPSSELREMWLHVRTPDGPWRRYAMEILKTPGGAAGAVVFPATVLGAEGRTSWYVSALTAQGDEYFTELRTAQSDRAAR